MARHRLSLPILAALLAAGCTLAPVVAPRTGPKILRVSAQFEAARGLQSIGADAEGLPSPWSLDDVGFVEFKLYRLGGDDRVTTDDVVVMASTFSYEEVHGAANGIAFAELAGYTRYRLEARAYADRDESLSVTPGDLVISRVDAAADWRRDITVSNDDEIGISTTLALELATRKLDHYAAAGGDGVALEVNADKCYTVVQGMVSTLAGRGGNSGDGSSGLDAELPFATAVAAGKDGDVFVAMPYDHVIKRIDGGRAIYRVVGETGDAGAGVGTRAVTRLNAPGGMVAVDRKLYVADTGNNRVLRIDTGLDDTDPDWAVAIAAITKPQALVADGAGNLFVTSEAPGSGGKVYRITDPGGATPGSAALPLAGGLDRPFGIAQYKNGDVNGLVVSLRGAAPGLKAIDPATNTVTAINMRGDADAILKPSHVAVDHANRIWVSDVDENDTSDYDHAYLLKCLDGSLIGDGIAANDVDYIKTWVRGAAGATAEDGLARDAAFPLATYFASASFDPVPMGIALDPTGFVYFTDASIDAVRVLQ